MDETTKFASIGVGIAFVIGLIYNYGYFKALDQNFFGFLTYKDHLTVLVTFAAPCLILALLFGALRDAKPKADYVAIFLGAATIVSLVEGDGIVGLPKFHAFLRWFTGFCSFLLIPYLIAAIVMFFFSSNDWRKQSPGKQGLVGISIIGLIVFIVVFGSASARWDTKTGRYEMDVQLAADDKTPSPPRSAHVVRAIDDGLFLIFQDAPDHIAYVRKESVKMLSEKLSQ